MVPSDDDDYYYLYSSAVGKKTEEGNKRKYNAANGPIVGETCQECGHRFQIGGPIWSEPMHDKTFVEGLLKRLKEESKSFGTSQRLTGRF